MKSGYNKIIAGILLLIATVLLFLWYPSFSPEILVCLALISIIAGIFEYKECSNRIIYWISIFVVLAPTLILFYLLFHPYRGNELIVFVVIGIFVIFLAWDMFRSIQNVEKVQK